MNIQEIEITRITTDGGTESRPLSQQVVSEYAEAYKADPKKLPPPDVFFDGTQYWAGDGFHRLGAAKVAGLKTIQVNVHQGDRMEALKHSLGSNTDHGYRRTPADKRYAVRKALAEFPELSNRMIADLCRVSPTFVGEVREECRASTVHVDSSDSAAEKRIGQDGKVRRLPARRQRAEEAGDQRGADDPPCIASETSQTPSACAPEPHEEANSDGVTPELEAEAFDASMITLDEACVRVVTVATQAMTGHPRAKSKVCTRLNRLRAELDQLIKGSLPQVEGLKRAA